MPHRYQAPQHTSGVFTPGSGEIRADEAGILELGDDASDADHEALRRAGCVPEGEAPAAPPAQAQEPAGEIAEASEPEGGKPKK